LAGTVVDVRIVSRVHRVLLASLVAVGVTGVLAVSAAQTNDHFTTPSGNIDCYLGVIDNESFASCLVESARWPVLPKQPADCDLDWSPTDIGVSSKRTGATFRNSASVGGCRGDIGPLCAPSGNDGCRVLAYGRSTRVGNITCTSAASGVTCRTVSGPRRGFTVSRTGYTLLR
jgi:hypothetical protein